MSQVDAARHLNPWSQSMTVFSGADPAIAQLEGGSAIVNGSDPTGAIKATLASWQRSGQPGGSATEASENAPNVSPAFQEPSLMTKIALAALAIGLVLIGALAIVGSNNAASAAAAA